MPSIPLDHYDLRHIADFLEKLETVQVDTGIDTGEFTIYYDGEDLGRVNGEGQFFARDSSED